MAKSNLSKCCKEPVKVHYGDEGTNCYICSKCDKPTDIWHKEEFWKCPHGTIGIEGTSCPRCKKEPVNCGIPPETERDPIHDTHIQYSQVEDATSWNPPQPKETFEEFRKRKIQQWNEEEDWEREFFILFLTQDRDGWVFKNAIYATGEKSKCDVISFVKSLKSRWQAEAREEQPIKNLRDEQFICERCLEQKTIQEVKITKDYKIICYYHFFPNKSHD